MARSYIVAVRDPYTVSVFDASTTQFVFTIPVPHGEINGTPTANGETIVIPYRFQGNNYIATYVNGQFRNEVCLG